MLLSRKLRACTFLAEHEPGYGPLASSSSSTNQFSDNGEGEFDKVCDSWLSHLSCSFMHWFFHLILSRDQSSQCGECCAIICFKILFHSKSKGCVQKAKMCRRRLLCPAPLVDSLSISTNSGQSIHHFSSLVELSEHDYACGTDRRTKWVFRGRPWRRTPKVRGGTARGGTIKKKTRGVDESEWSKHNVLMELLNNTFESFNNFQLQKAGSSCMHVYVNYACRCAAIRITVASICIIRSSKAICYNLSNLDIDVSSYYVGGTASDGRS